MEIPKIESSEMKYVMILLIYIVYKITAIALLPMAVGFSRLGGFEVAGVLQKFDVYTGVGAAFVVGTIATIIFALLYFKGDEKGVNGVYLLNPEKSILPEKYNIFSKPLNLIFIPLIFFSFLGLVGSLTGEQSFLGTGIPTFVEQQFTPSADIFFAVYPASPAEQSGIEFFSTLLMVLIGIGFKKNGIVKSTKFYLILGVIVILLSNLSYGVVNHELRYGFDERSVLSVVYFWSYQGFLQVLTGSFIPGEVSHDMNNLFEKLNGETSPLSNDIVKVISIMIFVLIVFIYISLLTWSYYRKKRKNI